MQIKDLSFQQELNLDEANIQGGFFDVASLGIQVPVQLSRQRVTARTGGANNINSPANSLGLQIPNSNAIQF